MTSTVEVQQNTGIPVRTGVSRAYRYGSAVRYVPVHSGVFGSLYGNCRSSVTRNTSLSDVSLIKWRKKITLWWKMWGEKQMFGDGSDLRKERLMGTLSKTLQCALTAVSVWNWLVVHPILKLTLDDTILSNKLLDLNPSTSLCSWRKICSSLTFPFFSHQFHFTLFQKFWELNTSWCWYVWFINISFFSFFFFFFFFYQFLFFLLKIHTRQR